ncbi:MAG TPA: M20 family metallo-hydrolase [Bryobacteraceae bacterium]
MNVRVNEERLARELDTLAGFSAGPSPGVTRIVFTRPDIQARGWLKGLYAGAGLAVREDAVGNTFATWQGFEPLLARIGTGSHIDAIPNSGQYDGTVGVLGALEAIRALQSAGFRPRRSIELLLFTSEEPTRFGLGCLGSRLLAGTLDAGAGERLRDRGGKSLNEVRAAAGFAGELDAVKLPPGYYHGFLELHIEQGPRLEREKVSLGVVTHIAAPAGLRLSIEGTGGHAGAVLMPERRDAFLAAAELALALETCALETRAIDTVATTGVCEVFPGAVNSIPSCVKLEIDVRDTDWERRDSVLRRFAEACARTAAQRKVSIQTELLNSDAPAVCDPAIVDILKQACEAQGQSYLPLVSRAYHDSLFVSRIAPVAMLFIPCKGGVSHRPDEFSSTRDIANGVRVLAHALAQLAS